MQAFDVNPHRCVQRQQVLLGMIGLFLGGVFGLLTKGITFKLLLRALLGGGLLYYLPELALSLSGKKRKEAVFLGLPDALDLMVVCVEAGLGLDQALRTPQSRRRR